MPRSNEASLTGSDQQYSVHPDAKRYTMRDNAFMETKNGNFKYERILSTNPGSKTAPKLMVTVSENFTNLKMSSVAANGVRKVDLYANDEMQEAREMAEFYLNNFVEEGILEEV